MKLFAINSLVKNCWLINNNAVIGYSNLKSNIEGFMSSQVSDKAVNYYLNIINEQSGLAGDLDWRIKQQFGYLIGSKKINGKMVYIVNFRGTGMTDIWTWIFTNFIALPSEFLNTGTHVHTGFEWYRQACWEDENVLPGLIDNLSKEKEDYILVLAGHSMGAAVALLQAAFIEENDLLPADKVKLIISAEPCPGRADFIKRYKNKIKKYDCLVNYYDVVPIAPMLFGYQHFGNIILFDYGKNYNPLDRHSPFEYQDYIHQHYK